MAHRSRRRPRAPFVGDPNGINKGDDIGNRVPKSAPPPPPDDIGNRRERSTEEQIGPDDVGNRIDAPPTHEESGILNELAGGRRRKKRTAPLMRVGRYFAGGVNPLVSSTAGRAQKASEEVYERQKADYQAQDDRGYDDDDTTTDDADMGEGQEGGGRKKRRRRRRDGQESGGEVDVVQDVNARRARRFFDFDDDDRFDYSLRSTPEQKRAEAEAAVAAVLDGAERDATVTAMLLDDGDRPKVVVTIDERGPAACVPDARRGPESATPLFVLGNAALMSLNYLTNKIVNRYPDDRIRLAILPKEAVADYLSAFEEHLTNKRPDDVEGAAVSIAAARAALDGQAPLNGGGTQLPALKAPRVVPKLTLLPRVPVAAPAAPRATPSNAASPSASDEVASSAPISTDAEASEADVETTPAKKKAAAKKTAAKKAPAKKAATKKTAEAVEGDAATPAKKKVAAKKAPAKKAAAKADDADAPAAKKTAAKKAPAKKAAAKKAPAKKAAAKKAPAAKKTATKKAPAKKADA